MRNARRFPLLAVALLPFTAVATEVAPRMLLLDGARVGREVVVVGERGTILRSSAEAGNWQRIPAPTRATLTAIAFAPAEGPRRGWAVGHDALILTTIDGGRTWTKQFQGENLQDSFLDVLALDAERAFVVGSFALMLATTDGGRTWDRRKPIDDDYHFNRLTRGPTGTLYLAGEHGTLLRSADDGITWTRIPTPYEGSFYGVLPVAARTLLAYGLRGNVFRSTDDGASWTQIPTSEPALLATALRAKNGTLLLAGQARSRLVSRDGGATFAPTAEPITTGVAELLELDDGRVLALGEAGATILPALR